MISCLSFNSDDTNIASGDEDGNLIISDLKNNKFMNIYQKSLQGMKSLDYNPFKNDQIGTAYDSGIVVIWDLLQQKPNLFLKDAHNAPASMIKYSNENSLLFSTVGYDKKLNFFDSKSQEKFQQFFFSHPLHCFEWVNANLFILGNSNGEISLHDFRMNCEVIDSLKISNEPILSTSFQSSEILQFQTPKKQKSSGISSTPFRTPINSIKTSNSNQFQTPNSVVKETKQQLNHQSNESIETLSNDLNDFRSDMNLSMRNIQMEMIRQSFNQEQTFKLVEVLLQEIQDLKEEVAILKKK